MDVDKHQRDEFVQGNVKKPKRAKRLNEEIDHLVRNNEILKNEKKPV